MKTTKYKGFTICMTEVNKDRVEFFIKKPDGATLDDSESYCVTIDEAIDNCIDIIEEEIENN